MITDAQVQYLKEVLGVAPEAYSRVSVVTGNVTPDIPTDAPAVHAATISTARHQTVVLTQALSPAGSDLLTKILASVKLANVEILEGPEETWNQLKDTIQSKHWICFTTQPEFVRRTTDQGIEWRICPVDAMLGDGNEVQRNKRAAWALLQQFAQEVKA